MADVGAIVVDQIGYYLASVATGAAMSALAGTPETAEGPRLGEFDPIKVAEGGRMWRAAGSGKVRTSMQVVWASKIHEKKKKVSVGSGKSAGAANTYAYSVDLVLAIGQAFGGKDGKGEIEKLWQLKLNAKTVYNAKKPKKGKHRYASLAIRLGGDAQAVLGVLESAKGAGKVSAGRNTAQVGFNELKLEDFGNGIPQVGDAIWQPDPYPYTVGQFILDVWARIPGRSLSEVNVDGVTGANTVDVDSLGNRTLQGIVVAGPESPRNILTIVMVAYDLAYQERNGVLHFYDRGTETVIDVPDSALGADSEDPEVRGQPLAIRDIADNNLPSEVVVNYFDEEQAWLRTSVRVKVNNPPAGENIVQLDLPLTLKREEARRIARRRAWEPYRYRLQVSWKLSPDWIDVQEGDVVALPFGGQRYYVRVTTKTTGANWLIEFEGVVLDIRAGSDEVLSNVAGSWNGDLEDTLDTLDPGSGNDDEDYSPPALSTALANLPAITDEEAQMSGFWLAHAAQDSEALWVLSSLFSAPKSSGKWKELPSESIGKETPLGFALTALPTSTAIAGFWDRINTVDVQLFEGSCATIDAEEVLAGNNWLAIGQGDNFEIIGFRDAVAIEALELTLTDATIIAPNILESLSSDFVALNVKVGRYVRILGMQEEDNADRLLKVESIDGGGTQLVFTIAGLDVPLVDEGTPENQVTLSQGDTYRLSTLLRGLRNTEDHASQHAIGDTVVIFESPDLVFLPHASALIGKKRWYKDVPWGQELVDVLAFPFISIGETMRPFSPVHLIGVRGDSLSIPGDFESTGTEGSDTVWLGWLHRTRLTHTTPTDVDLHELCKNEEHGKHGDRTAWRITVYNAATMLPADVVRVHEIKAGFEHEAPLSPQTKYNLIQFKYTTAMQTSDGVLGAQVWFKIQQLAKVPVKFGNPAFITVV